MKAWLGADGWLSRVLMSLILLLTLQGSSNAMDVTLAWDANNEPDLAGYLVYYDTDSGDPYSPASRDYATQYSVDGGQNWIEVTDAPPITVGPDVTAISVRGLSDSKDYFFAVKASNAEGLKSPYSREVSAIAPGNIAAPHNRGWRITSGELAGFTVLYNSDTDPGITPTLGSSEEIPPFDLPGLEAVGIPLNLQPDGSTFNTPVTIFLPCPGYYYIRDFSIGLFEAGDWKLVWDGNTQELTVAGRDWIDGLPQYLFNEDPPAIKMSVKHFSGVQASAPEGTTPATKPRTATTIESGGGGGGGCFISALGGK